VQREHAVIPLPPSSSRGDDVPLMPGGKLDTHVGLRLVINSYHLKACSVIAHRRTTGTAEQIQQPHFSITFRIPSRSLSRPSGPLGKRFRYLARILALYCSGVIVGGRFITATPYFRRSLDLVLSHTMAALERSGTLCISG